MAISMAAVRGDTPICAARMSRVLPGSSWGAAALRTAMRSATAAKPMARSEGVMLRWPTLVACRMKRASSSDTSPALKQRPGIMYHSSPWRSASSMWARQRRSPSMTCRPSSMARITMGSVTFEA